MSICIFLDCKEYFQEYAKIINKTQSWKENQRMEKINHNFKPEGE